MTEEQNADAAKATETAEETETGGADAAQPEAAGDLATQLSERTADLQRVTAEYHNYRKRVERDKAVAAEQVTATVVAGLLPILDDIDRAREHGDLEGPFATVAEQLLTALVKLGVEVFGEKGDPFDPMIHEAVAHMVSPEVTQTSCIDVMRRGYRIGDRLLRAAMVAVAEPAEAPAADGDSEPAATDVAVDPDADADAATGETAEPTPNLDADVPDDEEQLKAEQVTEAAESDEDTEAETSESEPKSDEPGAAESEPTDKPEK